MLEPASTAAEPVETPAPAPAAPPAEEVNPMIAEYLAKKQKMMQEQQKSAGSPPAHCQFRRSRSNCGWCGIHRRDASGGGEGGRDAARGRREAQ